MQSTLRLRLVQMTSTNAHEGNIATMRSRVAEAAGEGCELMAIPEASGLMNRDREAARRIIREDADDPFLAACREAAAKHALWIHTGSTPVRADDGRFLNRSHLIDHTGRIVAVYDKIHLFDVYLEDGQPRLESRRYAPGTEGVLADTPWGPWGMSVCYDLRFPKIYRDYAKAGATILFIPSAFTRPTGAAHWEPLLRARAIENGCYVVAAAQAGAHDDGRETWGHSLVVDPWGQVLADLGEAAGAVTLTLELDLVARTRAQIPSLANEREFTFKHVRADKKVLAGEPA